MKKKGNAGAAEMPDVSGVLDFLKRLSENNDRDWFNAHKDEYLQAKAKVETFVAWVLAGMQKFDRELALVDPRKCMYRIYRDIRFSNDKRPYKDYMGIFISKEGRHGSCSGYYIHLQPGQSFCGAGVYGLPPEKQKKVRDGIYFQSQALRNILQAPHMKKVYGGTMDESARMKVAPKGYDRDFPDMDLLKFRYYFVSRHLTDRQVSAPDFAAAVLENMRVAYPFNKFLNETLDF
ncbi:MAG: DUF2461 domain-containing protein [Bacteroides sp.]|nr:DUF2461 domain-containing protein [Bacteroides sp.]MCM1086376.1 DUF2461 domain-containing protein [Bacteroides sp.]MCM1169751.1 DUF2461 domain-containing protein [Bacteroides sp.]